MANTFVLTYDANGGTNAPEAQSITTGASSAVFTISSTRPTRSSDHLHITATCNTQGGSSVTAPSYYKNTSFWCESWNDNSSGSGKNYYSGGSITLYENKTIYAKWRESTYYTSITLPSPTRYGYSFSGWYSAATGGTRYGSGGSSYTPTADTLTMYAQWVANQYTISYNANGGTGAPASQQKSYGSSIKLSTTIPTLSGHSFLGWATSSSNAQNGRVTYAPGATYSENVSRTLYAVWKENYVLLYFDPDQYSDQSSGTTLKLSQSGSVKLPGAWFTRDGRVQTGWIRSSDSTHFALGESYRVYEEAHFTPEWSYPASAVTATNGTMGSDTDKVMITIDDNGHGYKYYVRAIMDSVTTNVASGTLATTLEFKPSIASYAPKVPNAKGGTLIIRCETVNSYQHTVGTTSTTCYISVPDTVKCTVGSIALSETVSGINEQFGGFVQGQSKAQVTITGDTSGAYGATVVGYSVGINGETSTDNPYTTGLLRDSGTNSVTATVTDTRGYSDTLTQSYTVYPWYAPSITVTADRTTTSTIALYYTWDIAAVNDSNTKSIKFSYRPYGSSSDPTVAATITPATYSGSGTHPITGLPANTAYEIYAEVTDFFTSIVASTMAPGVDGRIFHMSSTDRTVARHGANPSDGWDHQFFDERFHGDVDIDGDETVGGTLGVTGATTLADATVNGVLDVTKRRCYATLSSEGWYRVLSFNTSDGAIARGYNGQCIDFTITRQSAGAYGEIHKISYMAYLDSLSFVNEVSKSGVLAIDKIRYTRDSESSRKGHVDIHFNLSVANGVQVDYDVHTQQTDKGLYKSENLIAVAASPSGETVMTEYSFANNTEGNVSSSFSSSKGGFNAYRCGKMVTVTFLGNSTTWTADEVFGTIGSGVIPALSYIDVVGYIGRQAVVVRLNQNGNITLWIGSTLTGNQRLYFSCTYPIL